MTGPAPVPPGVDAAAAFVHALYEDVAGPLFGYALPATVSDEHALAVAPAADDLERAVQSWTVAEAMSRLTPEHRAVLVETYYEGRSVADAAQRLGVPAGTVKSRTYYALRALRLALEEIGETR